MDNIALEYRERDGWLHNLYRAEDKDIRDYYHADFQIVCEEVSIDNAIEFGQYLNCVYKDKIPTKEEVIELFEEFIKIIK